MQTLSKSSFMIRAVDDDPGVLDALRFALEASGWKIQTSRRFGMALNPQ